MERREGGDGLDLRKDMLIELIFSSHFIFAFSDQDGGLQYDIRTAIYELHIDHSTVTQ